MTNKIGNQETNATDEIIQLGIILWHFDSQELSEPSA